LVTLLVTVEVDVAPDLAHTREEMTVEVETEIAIDADLDLALTKEVIDTAVMIEIEEVEATITEIEITIEKIDVPQIERAVVAQDLTVEIATAEEVLIVEIMEEIAIRSTEAVLLVVHRENVKENSRELVEALPEAEEKIVVREGDQALLLSKEGREMEALLNTSKSVMNHTLKVVSPLKNIAKITPENLVKNTTRKLMRETLTKNEFEY